MIDQAKVSRLGGSQSFTLEDNAIGVDRATPFVSVGWSGPIPDRGPGEIEAPVAIEVECGWEEGWMGCVEGGGDEVRSVVRSAPNPLAGAGRDPTRRMPGVREVPGPGGPSIIGKAVPLESALTGKGRFERPEVVVVLNIAGSVDAVLKSIAFLVWMLVHVPADQSGSIARIQQGLGEGGMGQRASLSVAHQSVIGRMTSRQHGSPRRNAGRTGGVSPREMDAIATNSVDIRCHEDGVLFQ